MESQLYNILILVLLLLIALYSLLTLLLLKYLLRRKNIKLSSSQITLITHTKEKRKLQPSKSLDRDGKKKIKFNYYKKRPLQV